MRWFFKGKIVLHYSNDIIAEYNDVLHRDKLSFSEDKVLGLLSEITENGVYIAAPMSKTQFIDEDDRKFYDTAKASDAILVTGNKKHYPDEPYILSPAEFIDNLEHQ